MADFQGTPILLDVDDSSGLEAALPRTLQILVSDAQQVFPIRSATAQSVLLFAGTARFARDSNDPSQEDLTNEVNENKEVDNEGEGPGPFTLKLSLEATQFLSTPIVGSSSFAALGNVALATNSSPTDHTAFGAATDNAQTLATGVDSGGGPVMDIWFFSDVSVEKFCQMNRLGYQAAALAQTGTLMSPRPRRIAEASEHHNDFLIDLDVRVAEQVVSARTLDVGINDGQLVFRPPNDESTSGANRLLIFTGTALSNARENVDNVLVQGVVRIRLGFPVPAGSVIVKGSATMAALASFHANDEGSNADSLFAVNAAKTSTDPTDGNSVANPLNLPSGELYVIIDVGVLGAENGSNAIVSRIAYQANVLIQDTEPDLDSILVRPAGEGDFGPSTILTVGQTWEFQLTLTGPVLDPSFTVPVSSSDPNAAPIATPMATLNNGVTIQIFPGGTVAGNVNETVTITATGRHVAKSALLFLERTT